MRNLGGPDGQGAPEREKRRLGEIWFSQRDHIHLFPGSSGKSAELISGIAGHELIH